MEPTGVQFTEPPAAAIPHITASINQAIAALPPGAKGAVVSLVNEEGANAAIVAVGKRGWQVEAWIGKKWSEPDVHYGAAIRRVW